MRIVWLLNITNKASLIVSFIAGKCYEKYTCEENNVWYAQFEKSGQMDTLHGWQCKKFQFFNGFL